MTEFGLEIISTVETEDGQPIEFSTSASDKNLKKEAASYQPGDENHPDDEGTYRVVIRTEGCTTTVSGSLACQRAYRGPMNSLKFPPKPFYSL